MHSNFAFPNSKLKLFHCVWFVQISLTLFNPENANLNSFRLSETLCKFSLFHSFVGLASSHGLVIGTNCDIQGCPSAIPFFCFLKVWTLKNCVLRNGLFFSLIWVPSLSKVPIFKTQTHLFLLFSTWMKRDFTVRSPICLPFAAISLACFSTLSNLKLLWQVYGATLPMMLMVAVCICWLRFWALDYSLRYQTCAFSSSFESFWKFLPSHQIWHCSLPNIPRNLWFWAFIISLLKNYLALTKTWHCFWALCRCLAKLEFNILHL